MTERLAQPAGVLAILRLCAVPIFLAAERLVDHPAANSALFTPTLVLAAVYAVAALTAVLAGGRVGPPWLTAVLDAGLIAMLVATSGGPFSQLRYAFFLLPIGAALLLRPALTAAASAVAVGLYAAIALSYPDPTAVRSDAVGFEVIQGVFLIWMGAAATLLSWLLGRRAREVAALAASRGRLVAQALDADDRARRRLAEALHDDALQNLLAARQLLGPRDDGDLELVAEGLDRSVQQIRDAVFELHPYLLEHAGLRAALQAVADRAGERGGFAPVVRVEPAAEGVHDQLVFSLARELLANAAKHANAQHLELDVTRTDDAVRLRVSDDGRGLDLERVRAAPLRGHIGLASSAERVQAIGGSFSLARGPGDRGTRVEVELPAPVHSVA